VNRRKLIRGSVVGAAALAFLVLPSPSLDADREGPAALALVRSGGKGSDVNRPLSARSESPGTRIEDLPCFGCHNIERYKEGEEFSHSKHRNVGHCHVCHAFEGHFQVTIRRKTCEGCH
jgi:hypothetical protein